MFSSSFDRRTVFHLALFLSLCSAAQTTLAQTIQTRNPIPGADDQKKALALVREVYESKFAKARSDDDKLALAETIISEAVAIKANAADAFVMLRVARDIGISAGSISTANSAIDQMAARFLIDEVSMKIDAAFGVAKSAKTNEDRVALAEATVELIDRALAADRFKRAAELATVVATVARRVNQPAVARELLERRKEAETHAERYEDVEAAMAMLEDRPDDPAANEIVGRYMCLLKGDWDPGIAYLVLCKNENLQPLATADLKGATDIDGLVAIADAWWDYAEQTKGTAQENVRRRAGYWYARAKTAATGLTRTKIEKRLAQLQDAYTDDDAKIVKTPGNLEERGKWVNVLASIKPEYAIAGGFNVLPNGAVVTSASFTRIEFPIKISPTTSYDLSATFTRTQGRETVAAMIPAGTGSCTVVIAGWAGSVCGLSDIDGVEATKNPTTKRNVTLENNKPYKVDVSVRVKADDIVSIMVQLNDADLVDWEGSARRLTPQNSHVLRDARNIGVGAVDSKTIFHEVRIARVTPAKNGRP